MARTKIPSIIDPKQPIQRRLILNEPTPPACTATTQPNDELHSEDESNENFEEESITSGEEKSKSSRRTDGEEKSKSSRRTDGEEKEESNGEEQSESDGEEQVESEGDEHVESDGEEQEESDEEEQLESSSMSRDKAHLMEKISRLEPILKENEHFECKISIKSRMEEITRHISDVLKNDPTHLKLFKESPFGHFLDISDYYRHFSQVMWLLLVREADCYRDSEMWFVVNEIPIRFSLMEYALISGLKCSKYPEGWESQAESKSFKDRHFRGRPSCITIEDLKTKLKQLSDQNQKKKSQKKNEVNNEILKMASLLFVSAVLMHGDKKQANIDPKLLGLVDDLEMFIKFPWGTHSYEYTLKQLRKSLKEKAMAVHEKEQKMSSFTYSGFPLPLAILVYECIPAVANKYVELRDDIGNSVPRICRWRTTWKCKKSPSYSGVVEALGDSKNIKSILSPTKREKKMPHMQGFSRISESKSNNLIDILTNVLESGGTINWTDDMNRHETSGNVDVRNEEQPNVINEEEPTGQATEVGNTSHVQPMSEATRDDIPIVTPGYSPIHMSTHMSTPSPMYGPEARQSEKVDWCAVKAYIDQQFSLIRSEILMLPSKIILLLQQQNIHVEGQHTPHVEKQSTHVEEQSTHYEEQPLQDDVEGETIQVVQENPKRVPKRSHYLEPPYTDPFHYTKARRGDHIQFDPLRNIDSEKQKRFDEHLKSGESINCGLGVRTIRHFEQIIKEREWLFSEHIDDALFGIRKRQHLYQDVIPQDAIILDEKFAQLVTSNFNSNLDVIDNELSRYISGESPHLWGKKWKGAKKLYMTLNIKNHHWVTVKADIQTLELIVYDCSIGATSAKEMDVLMLPLQTMIPIMLLKSLQFQEIAQYLHKPWTYQRLLDVPQNSTGDCAVYAIKFIEFDMNGLSFESLSDDKMAFYRRKMAIDIFCQQWDP